MYFHYDVYDTDKNVFAKESERYASIKNIRCLWRPDDGRTYATHDRANEGQKKNKYESWGASTQGFTNRGGALGDNKFTITEKGCGKLIFNMFIDWNGNYNLCCDDWTPLVLGTKFVLPRTKGRHFRPDSDGASFLLFKATVIPQVIPTNSDGKIFGFKVQE